MDARLIALKLVLGELGIPPSISTVQDRKRLQKAIYVSQLSGVDLGYRYGWYLMGPYSPALTRDYYDMDAIGSEDRSKKVELKANIKASLSRVKPLFSVPHNVSLIQDDWLELLSSVHFLRKVSGYNKEQACQVLAKQKPNLATFEKSAEKSLKSCNLL